ncbi:uncharacterized protein [Clytia hemisphaerica]|uniref:uncharacterized protein n=1 Tax=Clytia hemisphaerica TaxID=252671 RepID=UPI0034D53F78
MERLIVLCIILVAMTTWCIEQEDWDRYLDNRYNYISHFSEMLRRKSDNYAGKRDEYQNWLVNYRETEREDQRTHTEHDDEKVEQTHENHEVMRERQREHSHNMGRHMIEKRTLESIIRTKKKANQFLKYRRRI